LKPGCVNQKKSLYDFQKTTSQSMESISRVMSLGIIGRTIEGVVDGITEMHKATKEGTSALVAFTEALPVFGNVERSFANMYAELAGVADLLKGAEKALEALGKRSEYLGSMRRELALLNAGDGADKMKALFKYQDMLEKIAQQEKAMREAGTSRRISCWHCKYTGLR